MEAGVVAEQNLEFCPRPEPKTLRNGELNDE